MQSDSRLVTILIIAAWVSYDKGKKEEQKRAARMQRRRLSACSVLKHAQAQSLSRSECRCHFHRHLTDLTMLSAQCAPRSWKGRFLFPTMETLEPPLQKARQQSLSKAVNDGGSLIPQFPFQSFLLKGKTEAHSLGHYMCKKMQMQSATIKLS